MTYNSFHGNPFNYTGSKFRYLADIMAILPTDDNLTVLDPFVGGGDLISKLNPSWLIDASDIDTNLIGLHHMFQDWTGTNKIMSLLSDDCRLSRFDPDSYQRLKDNHNKSPTPMTLYLLLCHSFGNIIRHDSKGNFDVPFGKRTFNASMKKKFDNYVSALKGRSVNFYSGSYKEFNFNGYDLLLIDPPYSNTTAAYSELTGWGESDDIDLLNKIDAAVTTGTKFVYFNQLVANGTTNQVVAKWFCKYNVKVLKTTTNKCFSTKKQGRDTIEIMVWN